MKKIREMLLNIKPTSDKLFQLSKNNISIDTIDSFLSQLRALALTRLPKLSFPIAQAINAPIDVVDFFSGCGGMTLGFETVSTIYPVFKSICGLDIDKHAASTFKLNFGIPAFQKDIRELVEKSKEELNHIIGRTSLKDQQRPLIVIGCAPCQGFSSHRKKDKRIDPRNTLIGQFAIIATKLNPAAIVMENVPDLLAEKHWPYFKAFQKCLEEAGYTIKVKILNSAEFGVPQERFRALILAFKNKTFSLPEGHLARNSFKTVRDAIGSLSPLNIGEIHPTDPMHVTSKHRPETVSILKRVPKDGGSRPIGIGPKCLDNVAGFYDVYGRLAWSKPAVTITARCRTPSCGRFAHPEQDRGLSVREAALLQSFPKKFMFEGPFDDKFKQIGNAVPPALATSVAVHVLGELIKSEMEQKKSVIQDQVTTPLSNSYSSVIAWIKMKGQKEVLFEKKSV